MLSEKQYWKYSCIYISQTYIYENQYLIERERNDNDYSTAILVYLFKAGAALSKKIVQCETWCPRGTVWDRYNTKGFLELEHMASDDF